MIRFIWLAILAAILQLLSGCVAVTPTIGRPQAASTEGMGVLVTTTPSVTIIVPNGGVALSAGTADHVRAMVTRTGFGITDADAQAAHDSLDVAFSQRGADVTLEARQIGSLGPDQDGLVDLAVTVPEGSTVTIRVANGAVVAEPVGGDVTVEAANGQVTFRVPRQEAFRFAGAVTNGAITSGFAEVAGASGQGVGASGAVGDAPAYTLRATVNNGEIELRAVR